MIALTNASGSVVAKYSYDAWGKVTSVRDASNNIISSSTHIGNVNPIRYRGYYYDTDTQLYYLQSRYYDPEVGRFINADSPELTAMATVAANNTNLFAYCGNSPISRYDKSGHLSGLALLFLDRVGRAVLGGVSGLIGGAIAGESGAELWNSALEGAFMGAISGTTFGVLYTCAKAVQTFQECQEQKMGFWSSLFCAGLDLANNMILPSSLFKNILGEELGKILGAWAIDYTLGMALSATENTISETIQNIEQNSVSKRPVIPYSSSARVMELR